VAVDGYIINVAINEKSPLANARIVAALAYSFIRAAHITTAQGIANADDLQEGLVQRRSIVTTASFDAVTAGIDAAIGHLDKLHLRRRN
jgi:hypothetical protein